MSKKTKLVTSYYAQHWDPPFWGQQGRDRWYKYSIANICNMGVETICYTDNNKYHNHSLSCLEELEKLKEEFQLDNLIIKDFPLQNNPWHQKINNIRTNNPETYNNPDVLHLYRRSSQIYWLKFKLLEMEVENDINLYWIDGGLSHEGLFPKCYSTYGEDEEAWKNRFVDEGKNWLDVEYRYFTYDKAFTPLKIEEINKWNDGKIINLVNKNSTDNDINLFKEKINYTGPSNNNTYPVAALIGGNSNLISNYVKHAYDLIDKVLDTGDYLSLEQEIMWYINHQYPNMFKNWEFNTFYHKDWDFYNTEEYGTSFSDFFGKPLN